MFKKNNKNNEEVIRMEQTTFIQRHAKKILIAGGVVVTVGAGYLLHKHNVEIKDLLKKHDVDLQNKDVLIEGLSEALLDSRKDNDTLMAAASEGLFEEAIATVTRKINGRRDKLEALLKRYETDLTVEDAITKVKSELDILIARKESFLEAQSIFGIEE